MNKTTIIGIVFMLILSSLAIAQPTFQPPHLFYGDVTVNGNPAPDGLLVVAKIDGEDVGASATEDGKYSVLVQDPYGDRTGDTVDFYVEDSDTGESAVFSNDPSAKTEVDLDIDGIVICGDGVCNSAESCSSCPADCGTCKKTGGGGSSSSRTTTTTTPVETTGIEDCIPDWICSDWLDCINGVEKRVCVDASKCGTNEGRPAEEKECVVPEELEIESIELEEETEANKPFDDGGQVDLLDGEAKKTGLAKITGAVIGGGTASWVAGIIVLMIIGGILLYIKREKLLPKKKH